MLLKRTRFLKATKAILLCSNFNINFHHLLLYLKRYFPKYDLVNSNIIDNLHTIYLGVVKKIIEKALEKKIFGPEANLSIIDDKMVQNFGTKEIERCGSFFMTANWKGKDFQNFLLFYGVPLCCTYSKNNKIIDIFKTLSEAIFILSGRMLNDDLVALADKKINDCLFLCTEIFGEYIITPNFHELSHLSVIIKKSGPLWLHSTFNFESLNNTLRNCVRSSLKPELQIIDRLNMIKSLPIEHSSINNKIVPLGSRTNSKFKRIEVGGASFSTVEYSNKFKETDCYFELDEKFFAIIQISNESDSNLEIIAKQIEAVEITLNTFLVEKIGEAIKIIPNLCMKKLCPVTFDEKIFLCRVPYDLLSRQ